jgi:hypothetical protein
MVSRGTSSAHADKQNAEFALHVSDLGQEQGYYYMHLNAPFGTNRNKWLALDIGRQKARELKRLLAIQHRALKFAVRQEE